ncbi:MAG TPA: amidohydrolase family protein [Pyrinomonadaceae bacterium]|nr:amidohydrolase family protein [Pyrinomonadaceae bacterium]
MFGRNCSRLLGHRLHYGLLCLALFCAIAGQSSTGSPSHSEQVIALVGGTVIDGNGGPLIENSVVVIQGNKITSVASKNRTKVPKAAKVIDVTGKYILPGLIDMHIHYHDWMGELFLAHGVTTVKDLGNVVEWISAVSTDVAQGKMRGPRIFYVGNGLDAPPPARETHVGVDSPAMTRRAVQLLHSRGACAIKIREKITPELLQAITEEAHRLGIKVTGHLRRTDAHEAALARIDGLEHASGIVQAIANRPRETQPGENELQTFVADLKSFAQLEPAQTAKLITLLASRKVVLIPTMVNWWRMATDRRDDFAGEDAEYSKNQSLAYVPDDVRKWWASSAIYNVKNADDLATIKSGFKKLQDLLLRHYRTGGKVLAASDTFNSVPGLSLQRELILMVDAGFTPMQAIMMATHDNAEFLGKGADLGTIGPGKWADIVVLNANPLADIRNIKQVAMVLKDGQVLDLSYHADYSIPTPKPKITRPVWLEKELQGAGVSSRAARGTRSH